MTSARRHARDLFLGFWFFQAEEMDMAAGVPGNKSTSNGCTTISCAIVCKRGSYFSRLHSPHLQRPVIRCGYGARPVPTQRHAPDQGPHGYSNLSSKTGELLAPAVHGYPDLHVAQFSDDVIETH